ncbi:MAG: 50S ribosomal protein L24 [Candidatus Auribacter fodinae]|jgi:large subunit ribosomal protein L24|uniref:Large ribosomal subunit protein uL24 n=1 Tax=Candidatus Auribacter fodinae TaxID=2093366 RepID=A0A3A4R7X6_9BACT|nr:MAG: 50S ribosomal protein L24 [Candidatus Auribacter fodinae]
MSKPKLNKVRFKKNDQVIVIAGKDKGKQGKVLEVDRDKGRIIIEGINFMTNYDRPTQQNPKGGISKKEGPIDISNVLPYSEKAGKGIRVKKFAAENKL